MKKLRCPQCGKEIRGMNEKDVKINLETHIRFKHETKKNGKKNSKR